MFDFVFKFWIEFMFSILISIVSLLYRKMCKYSKNQRAIKDGVKALLYNNLITKCRGILARGYITIDEMEDLKYSSKPYFDLQGNETAKKLIEKAEKLPVREV